MPLEEMFTWVRVNRLKLLADRDAGNATAITILVTCNLLLRQWDEAATGILEGSIREYQREQVTNSQ